MVLLLLTGLRSLALQTPGFSVPAHLQAYLLRRPVLLQYLRGTHYSRKKYETLVRPRKCPAGTLTGPLAGVPVAVKDNLCTQGMLTTCGSKMLYNFIPTYTAEAVQNLGATAVNDNSFILLLLTGLRSLALQTPGFSVPAHLHSWKNKYGRICHGKHHRNFCLWSDQKSLEYRSTVTKLCICSSFASIASKDAKTASFAVTSPFLIFVPRATAVNDII